MTSRSTFKKFERRIARRLGTERTPLSGSGSRHTRSDTLHPDFFLQIKKRDSNLLLKEHREAWERTKEEAEGEGKVPVYCFGKKYQRDEDATVLLRFEDFLKLAEGK